MIKTLSGRAYKAGLRCVEMGKSCVSGGAMVRENGTVENFDIEVKGGYG